MSKPTSVSVFQRSNISYYQLAVILIGSGLLLWGTLFAPPPAGWPWYSLVIGLFVAFLANFPLTIFGREVFLFQVITLGGGLLYGPMTAAWAAAGGILLGFAIRSSGQIGTASLPAAKPTGWFERIYILSRHNAALLDALFISSFRTGIATSAANSAATPDWINIGIPLLVFPLLHAILFLADAILRSQRTILPTKRDLVLLILVELLPLPFILTIVIGYSAMGIGSLIILGSFPALVAVLVNGMSSTRTDLDRHLQELSTLNQVSQVLRASLDLDNLLNVIHVQVSQLLDVDNFYVALYEPEERRIWYPLSIKNGKREQWSVRGIEDRLTERVILQRKPIMISHYGSEENASIDGIDLPPSTVTPIAWIGVPLISSDRAIGCLALFSLSQETEFSQSDLNLLMTLSGPISVGIENALIFNQAQRRSAQLETLNQISTLITGSLDPQEVLAMVCKSVIRVVGGSRSAIYLLDPEESQVWLAYGHELSEEFMRQNQAFSIAQNGRTRCLRTGRPVLTARLTETTLEQTFLDSLAPEGIKAFGDFPLITPEGQIGFLSVYFNDEHRFNAEEIELLQTFASQAALAVSNARLHARTDLALSRRAHQLSILEAVGRELSAATHSERLFEMILNYAREITNSPWASLGLYNPASGTIEIKACKGYREDQLSFSVDQGISGRSVRSKQTIYVEDIQLDSDYIDLTNGEARSQLSIPLMHEGRVLGVLSMESPQANGYSTNDQAFVSQLATQAAIAVVNSELYTETQRRLREQSTLYLVSANLATKLDLESVLHTIQRAMEAALEKSITGIYLWDEIDRVYTLQPISFISEQGLPNNWQEHPSELLDEAPTRPVNQHLPAEIAENALTNLASALLGPELIQFSSGNEIPGALLKGCSGCGLLVFPLIANQQRLGMIVTHTFDDSRPQSDEELQLLRAIVAQGAISIQNALLFYDVTHGRDRLAAVLNSVHEGILMIEAGGRIMIVNESIRDTTGLLPIDLTGKRLVDLPEHTLRIFGYSPQDAEELTSNLENGQVPTEPKTTLKVMEIKPERVLERTSLPVWGRGGRAIGCMIVLRDVTEEHQITEARELITETLVHDLRSPLSAVLGALDVMEESAAENQQTSTIIVQALNVARRSARRVLGMVESMLDISRMQSGSMEINFSEIDLHAQVSTLLADFIPQANEYGIILRNEIPDDLPLACVDQSKFTRVLTNLLDNALKFTPSGGQVTLAAERYLENMVVLRVSDTGPGIPDGYREKIFERFSQIPGQSGRRRGSGLGLTFCRLAVEAHGGQIWVDPRPGGGSIFTLTLPLA